MVKQFWINLPSKDVKKSIAFYTNIGFKLNPNHPNSDKAASFFIGESKIVLMIFDEPTFKGFTNTPLADAATCRTLLSIDAQNKEEVDELAKKATDAGGKTSHKPTGQQSWMYGCVFPILMGISGMCFIWIGAKCRKGNAPTVD